MGALKRLFGAQRLAAIDGALQRPLAPLTVAPSMFTLCTPIPGPSPAQQPAAEQGRGVFACPTCRVLLPTLPANDELRCANGHRWSVRGGIYDFKTPL
jgi:hypothetical protein